MSVTVATDDLDIDPSNVPTPELTPGDGSPDGRSVEVTPVLGAPAASLILVGISSPEASGRRSEDQSASLERRRQPELTSVEVSGT
ncbi:hypothetical protein Hamer_G000067 [Homarus americanus]|uniref:Uncharacterized protein n=1 Tax=Homarus americanus TaxID=6706 RepID=A0A8J5NCG6_HOMAM|nr:hypothetical protein Hamer_G000067 [Homarus americanus]